MKLSARRCLSVLMTLMMVLSMIPSNVLAASTDKGSKNAGSAQAITAMIEKEAEAQESPQQDAGAGEKPQNEGPEVAPPDPTNSPGGGPSEETEVGSPETPSDPGETNETPAPEGEIPAPESEIPVPESETPSPEDEIPVPESEMPAPEQTETELSLTDLSSRKELYNLGEEISWTFSSAGAWMISYAIHDANGGVASSGQMADGNAVHWQPAASGAYTLTLTALSSTDSKTLSSTVYVTEGKLSASVSTESRYAFAGEDTVLLSAKIQGGVWPRRVEYSALLDGEVVWTAEGDGETVTFAPSEFGAHTIVLTVTDAYGATAKAECSLPVAVREVETPSDWSRSVSGANLTGDYAHDIVAIALTQVGYQESERNFIINEKGKMQGYTRYGDWYGAPYDEWCAMFVAFCAAYANIPSSVLPREGNCANLKRNIGSRYVDDKANYQPKAGDLVFFHFSGGETPKHIGIVSEAGENQITVVEGNSAKAVRVKTYALTNANIIGYVSMSRDEALPDEVPETDDVAISEAAQRVMDRIAALAEPTPITAGGIAPLYEARLMYDALTDEEKATVANVDKLESLWQAMRAALPAAVLAVVDAIDALPDAIVTDADRRTLAYAGELLAALTDGEAELVYNIAKLWALQGDMLLYSGSVSYTAEVVWNDSRDAADQRPEDVLLTLYANDEPRESVKIDSSYLVTQADLDDPDIWAYTWNNLPGMDGLDPIAYTVKQDPVNNYRATYNYGDAGKAIVTNEHLNGSLSLNLERETELRIQYANAQDPSSAVVQYTPFLRDEKQIVRIILPPFFNLASTPDSGQGYTVETSQVPVPEQYYKEDNAGILKGSGVTCTQLLVSFGKGVEGAFSLSFAFHIVPETTASSKMQSLSELMVLYGENPDKIPLKLIVTAEDANGNVVSKQMIEGNTKIKENKEFTWPLASSSCKLNSYAHAGSSANVHNAGYLYNTPSFFGYGANLRLGNVASWHYPYTDMFLYFPAQDGANIGSILGEVSASGATSASKYWIEGYTDIGGKRYAKIGVNNANILNIYAPFFMHNRDAANAYDMIFYTFPDIDTLLPGDVIRMGEVYVDYTYMGQQTEQKKIWSIEDHKVPSYNDTTITHTFKVDAGGFSNDEVWLDRLQGRKSDQYQVVLGNAFQDNLSYVYDDADVVIEIPYEVSPTYIYCGGTHNLSFNAGPGVGGSSQGVSPTSVSYWVDGANLSGAPTNTIGLEASSGSVSFPETDAERHIVKIAIHYEKIYSTSTYTFIITADNADVGRDGKPLPPVVPVEIKTSIVSAGRILADEDEGRRSVEACTPSASQTFYLLGKSDALLFGTYTPSNRMTTALCNGGTGTTPAISNNWRFSLVKSKALMQNYENVVISVKPNSPEDAKALSKIVGFSIGNGINWFAEDVSIRYKTNKSGGAFINQSVTTSNVTLKLGSDEYVVDEIQIVLGKINGERMNGSGNADDPVVSDEVWNHSSAKYTAYTIAPNFNQYRYYFTGNPDATSEYPVVASDSHTLVATISTDTPAKYINGTESPSNTTSTGTVEYQTGWKASIYKSEISTATNWSESKAYYRSGTFSFMMNFASLYCSSMGNAKEIYYHDLSGLKLYLEVDPGFSITSLNGFDLLEVRPLGNGSNLYIYTPKQTLRVRSGYEWLSGAKATVYVHPDAELGQHTLIRSAGFSLDAFVKNYMYGGYEANYPYYAYTFRNSSGFPADWGITEDEVEHQLGYSYKTDNVTTNTVIKIERLALDTIVINPGVNGAIQLPVAEFYDYQKDALFARAWMGNVSKEDLPEYEAIYELPRAGVVTGSSDHVVYQNEFSMYLRGAATLNSAQLPTGTTRNIAYELSDSGSWTESVTDWSKVTRIKVTIQNFPAEGMYSVTLPLMTDYEKIGAETNDIMAYVGATRRYRVGEEWMEWTRSVPAAFDFISLRLKVQVGLDTTESGARASVLSDVVWVSVYCASDKEETALYREFAGNLHEIRVNPDVSKVTAEIVSFGANRDTYVIGRQNASLTDVGVTEAMDSDFPRVMPNEVSKLDVDYRDLINTSNSGDKYDINLMYQHKVALSDMHLRVDQQKQAEVALTPMSISSSARNKYGYAYRLDPETGNADIATVTADGMGTGVSIGDTGYMVTVKNTLADTEQKLPCDTVVAQAKIYVTQDFEVSYDANATAASGQMDAARYRAGEQVVVSVNGFTYAYHHFTGWNTEADGSGTPYAPGDTFTMGKQDVVLYAQWDCMYLVEHYLQTAAGSYELQPMDTQSFYGPINAEVFGAPRTYANYRFNAQIPGTVASGIVTDVTIVDEQPTEMLVLRLYYELAPDLSITKTADKTEARAGEELTYTVSVSNSGQGAARGIAVQEALPGNVSLKKAVATHGAYDEKTNTWTIGEIAPGGAATLTLTVVVSAGAKDGDTVRNSVAVTKENGEDIEDGERPTDEVVTHVKNPKLSISKTADKAQVRKGDPLTFTITVKNSGAGAAKNVVVREPLPANVTFVSATASSGSYDRASGLWTIAEIKPGSRATLVLVVTAGSGATVKNTVSIIGENGETQDPNAPGNTAEVEVPVYVSDSTSVAVRKVWEGVATGATLPSVTVRLLQDGKPYLSGGNAATLTLSKGNWSGSFDNLPKYAPDGHEYHYSVAENAVSGFTASYSGSAEAGYTVTNTARMLNVYFVDWNGTLLKHEQVPYWGSATPPANPTRKNYTFTGWNGKYTNVIKDEYVIAKYRRNGGSSGTGPSGPSHPPHCDKDKPTHGGTDKPTDTETPPNHRSALNYGDCVE